MKSETYRYPGDADRLRKLLIEAGLPECVASQLSPISLGNASEIEGGISTFAHEPNRGLIVVGSGSAFVHREQIIALAARYQLPAVYPIGDL